MRKVANRKIIRRLAVRSIRENKKKYIPIIAAVMLTTVMFTALFSIGMSIQSTTQRSTMRQVGGSSMAGMKYGLEEDYEKLKADGKVKDISYRIAVGMLVNKELDLQQTEVNYATDGNAKSSFCYPDVGHMPKEKDEVALSSITMEKLGIQPKLGQTVSLDIAVGEAENQNVYTKDFTLCGYWAGDPVAMAQMCYVSREYQMEIAPDAEKPYDWESYDPTGYWMIDFNFDSSFDIEGQLLALFERCGYDPEQVYYGVNWAYSFSTVDPANLVMLAVLILIILLAGYLIIYNIFYLNVTADIHDYGLLKTIGTSGRQLLRMVRMQAAVLSAVGIPLGLVFGTVVAKGIFPYIIRTFDVQQQDFVFSISPFIYVFACAFSMLTVFIGCRKPGRVARNVSAIEAVSYTPGNTSYKKKRKATHKVTPFSMAVSNLGRNKKKVCVVALSLSLSVVLVNSVYAIVRGMDADKFVSSAIIGDFSVHHAALDNAGISYDERNVVDEDTLAAIGGIDGVTGQSNVYYAFSAVPMNDKACGIAQTIVDRVKKDHDSGMTDEIQRYIDDGYFNCDVYGIDAWMLGNLTAEQGSIDRNKFESGDYAIVNSYTMLTSEDETFQMYEVGDEIEVPLPDGTIKSYKVMALAEMPYAISMKRYFLLGGSVLLPQSEFLAHTDERGALYSILNVEPDQLEAAGAQLDACVSRADGLSVVSKQTYLDEFHSFVQMFEIAGGALAVILALIGILNFANAIITGILRRVREFAMMEAVGMTKRQLFAMLVWEGMCYGIITTVAAVVLYGFVGGILIDAVVGGVWFFTYRPTFVPILVCLPVLLALAGMIPYVAGRALAGKSVVERMRV